MSQREIIRFGEVQDISAVNPRGQFHYPMHWHSAAEFILARRDGCVYRVGEEEYRLDRGDLLLIWPRELHELVSSPEGGTLFIQFSAGLLESNRDLAVSTHMLMPLHALARDSFPQMTERLAEMMNEIMDIYSSGDFFRETRCKLVVYRLLLLLAEHAYRTKINKSEIPNFSSEAWARIQQACAYIDAHYTENLRQTDVADAVGLSHCYFSRLFKRYMQASFPEYLSRVRVHEAVRLLGNSDMTITECAYQAGFQSITVFNKAFLECTGSAPREYRRYYQTLK